jgi:hypothetical protein
MKHKIETILMIFVTALILFMAARPPIYTKPPQARCGLYITSDTANTLELADTFYVIHASFANGENNLWTATDTSCIYTGTDSIIVLFNGTSQLTANKVSDIEYALFFNGETIPRDRGFVSKISVKQANAFEDISITRNYKIAPGDEVTVRAKTNTAATIITIDQLSVTFVELE